MRTHMYQIINQLIGWHDRHHDGFAGGTRKLTLVVAWGPHPQPWLLDLPPLSDPRFPSKTGAQVSSSSTVRVFPDPSEDVLAILLFDAVTNYIYRHGVERSDELKAHLPSGTFTRAALSAAFAFSDTNPTISTVVQRMQKQQDGSYCFVQPNPLKIDRTIRLYDQFSSHPAAKQLAERLARYSSEH